VTDDPGTIRLLTEVAIDQAAQNISAAIQDKIGRKLSDDERAGVAKMVGTDDRWVDAEEMLLSVRQRSAQDMEAMITDVGNRFRRGETLTPWIDP